MPSKEYNEKWHHTLDVYEDLVNKNQVARNKLINAAKTKQPADLSEEEIHSLEDEKNAWEIFLTLARNPY